MTWKGKPPPHKLNLKLQTPTRAWQLSGWQTVSIYTVCQYTFRVLCELGMLWKQRDFLLPTLGPQTKMGNRKMAVLVLFFYLLKLLSSKLRLPLKGLNLNIREMPRLTFMPRDHQKNLQRLWHMCMKSLLPLQNMTPHCQIFAILMSW